MHTLAIETRIVDKRLGNEFPLPTYATTGAAGMDLRACLNEATTMQPGETLLVNSGIAISIRNPAYMAMLAPRSGLSVKHGIVLANTVGVIDSDYQDEIRVALFHRGNVAYAITPGERICQLIIAPVVQARLHIVEAFGETTARGTGGFGSTGKN